MGHGNKTQGGSERKLKGNVEDVCVVEELRCGGAVVWRSCGVEELWCGVDLMGETLIASRVAISRCSSSFDR
jgi:hypothetical protein